MKKLLSKNRTTSNIPADMKFRSKMTKNFKSLAKLSAKKYSLAIHFKGNNMKQIIDNCSKMFPQQFNKSVKLRLRGRGSGYKEGPEKQGIFPTFLTFFRFFNFIRYLIHASI